VLLLALGIAPPRAAASTPHYSHREWLQPDGLPHNAAERLLMARDGWLWIGTRAGLARFDGVKFTVFDSRTPGFTDDAVLDLAEDAAGALWVATKKGLYRKDGERFTRLTQDDGLPHNQVNQLAPGKDGSLWLATQGGVSRILGSKIATHPHTETVYDANMHPEMARDVTSVALGSGGAVWVGTRGGLRRLDPDAGRQEAVWRPPVPLNELNKGHSQRLLLDREGRLWFGGEDALYLRGEEGWVALPFPAGAGDLRVRQLLQDESGRIWAVRGGAIFQVEGRSVVPFAEAFGLADAYVTDLLPENGRVWVATRHRGLHCLEPTRLRMFSTRDGLCHNSVVSVAPERGGGLWVATARGVMRMRSEKFEFPQSSQPLENLATLAVLEDRAGVVWISSPNLYKGPLFGLEPTAAGYQKLEFEAHFDPRNFFEDREGKLWVGGLGGLQCLVGGGKAQPSGDWSGTPNRRARPSRWHLRPSVVTHMENALWREFRGEEWRDPKADPPAWKPLSQADRATLEKSPLPIGASWPNHDFQAVHQTPDGAVWLATWGGGVARLLDGKVTTLGVREGLASSQVHCLLADTEGLLWAGTAGGLARIEPSQLGPSGKPRVTSFTPRHGLPHAEANQLVEDHLGNLWVGCGAGIYRVARAELAALAAGAKTAVEVLLLDGDDGLPGAETTGRQQPSACRTPDGFLWFATPTGLARIDPAAAERKRQPPKVLMESIISGKRTWPLLESPPSGPTTLPAGAGASVSIEFTALDYAAPKDLRFRHRLEGLDNTWAEAGAGRAAQFTNLDPGRYEFHVQVAGRDGRWMEPGASLAFQITPHCWQTAWFQLLAGSGVLLAVVLGVEWRLRVLRQLEKAEASAALVRQRELLARDLHDDLGSRLAQLSFLGDMAARDPSQASRLAQVARETARDLDCLVWTVDPERGGLDQLVAYLGELADDFLSSAGLDLELALPPAPPPTRLPDPARKAVMLAAKEALRNVVKHARATRVRLAVELRGGELCVAVEDNGRGLPKAMLGAGAAEKPASPGHGVANMRRRMAEVGGSCEFQERPGGGAVALLRLPVGTPSA